MCLADEIACSNAEVRARRRHFRQLEIMVRTLQAMPLIVSTILLGLAILEWWSG